MSVRAKKIVRDEKPEVIETVASDIMKEDHPVHPHFLQWLANRTMTKRKAREFLRQFPGYRKLDPAM